MSPFARLTAAATLAAALASSAAAQDSTWQPVFEATTQCYTPSLPIADALDGFETNRYRPGGRAAFTYNRIRAGARRGAWDFGLLARYDYRAEYSPDVGEVGNLLLNDADATDGSKRIDLEVDHFRGLGGELGYTLSTSPRDGLTLDTRIGVEAFASDSILDGRLIGNLDVADNDVDVAALAVTYRYTEDILFGRITGETGTGYGGSLNLRTDLRGPGWQVRIAAHDFVGRVRWSGVDTTVADADTQTLTRDSDGLINVRPTLRGRNFQDDYTQRLPTRWEFGGRADVTPDWSAVGEAHSIGRTWLATLGADYSPSDTLAFGPRAEITSGALGGKLRWHAFHLRLVTDSLSPSRARYLDAKLGLHADF